MHNLVTHNTRAGQRTRHERRRAATDYVGRICPLRMRPTPEAALVFHLSCLFGYGVHASVPMRPKGSPADLEHRRRLAVQRVVEGGYSVEDVAEVFGVDGSSVRRWVEAYHRDGEAGLRARPVPGRPRKLTSTQEKIVGRWLQESPTALGFPTELWTARRLARFIEQEFKVRFTPEYMTVWLRKRGYTPQKPKRVPRERDPAAIAAWLRHDWPRIKREAARRGAWIALIDESGLLMTPLVRRSWAPRGQQPILRHQGRQHEKVSVAAALWLSPRRDRLGLFFKTLINDYFNNFYVAAFIEALLLELEGPLIVLWDGGQNHRGDAIRSLMEVYGERLGLERLPPYAPILNPVEQVWSWLKFGRLCNFAPDDTWDLDRKVVTELMTIREDQNVLWGFFEESELPVPCALLI
jgi:transposase